MRPISRLQVAAAITTPWLALTLVGNAFPFESISPDTWYVRTAVAKGVVHRRWMLTLVPSGDAQRGDLQKALELAPLVAEREEAAARSGRQEPRREQPSTDAAR